MNQLVKNYNYNYRPLMIYFLCIFEIRRFNMLLVWKLLIGRNIVVIDEVMWVIYIISPKVRIMLKSCV